MHIFFTSGIDQKNICIMNKDESKHCIKVLRLGKGEMIHLTDGRGGFYTAEIIEDDPKKCTLHVLEKINEYGKRDYSIHIAIAPVKNSERFEWFLEKSTEIGIEEITPVICENSERRILKPERLNRIIISSMKQSGRAYKPHLNEIINFSDFVKKKFYGKKYIAHCAGSKKENLKSMYNPGDNVIILIGPEGDFTFDEIRLAVRNEFMEVSLGSSRLRGETAGIVACHTINLLND